MIPLKQWLRDLAQVWRDMPSYFKIHWESYEVRLQPNSAIRLMMMLITFRKRDIMPVFDGTELAFNVRAIRTNKQAESKLHYEWAICEDGSDERVRQGLGDMVLRRTGWVSTRRGAINFEPLTAVGRYAIKIRLTNNFNGSSDYKIAARFTVRDWDDFCKDIIWPVLVAVLLASVGGVVGWFSRGGRIAN